ncbi:hypothetical protein SLS53_004584 [Cytospora paraplurivora]|uniref:Uncharacterized protein n=1 Tax=Cytospora paraplurivora TaxID=2898453 RepID=A0AAN9YG08_9PEZI
MTSPLALSFPNYAQAFATWTVKGLEEIGIASIPGFLSGKLLGQSYVMTTIDAATGIRATSEAFLQAALGYPDYTVYQRTMAKRILFDDSKRATGVQVDTAGLGYTISAAREVIVSGGVFGSPQLLQASGIGPTELLSRHGIPIVADRPGVGQGMQDHIYYTVTYRVNAPTLSKLGDSAFAARQAAVFRKTGGGMYSNPVTEVIGWEKIPQPLRSQTMSNDTLGVLSQYPADWPEMEYISAAGFVGYQNSTTAAPTDGHNYASLAVVLITPRSRGSVNITSADTYVNPAINPNFLVDPVDIEVTLAGFKRARQFWETDSMSKFRIGDEYFPGNGTQTDDEIKAFIREGYNTIFHGSCTCAMGKRNDANAVVDSEARVIGVKGLRVVDASAFPFLPPGHPQSTIYALAEKISCVISKNC